MPATVRIDMVSDTTCPWCAIALFNLLHALRSLEGEIQAKLHLQPLELHPSVKAAGEIRAQYLQQHQRPAPAGRRQEVSSASPGPKNQGLHGSRCPCSGFFYEQSMPVQP